jgi:hypothetical protein
MLVGASNKQGNPRDARTGCLMPLGLNVARFRWYRSHFIIVCPQMDVHKGADVARLEYNQFLVECNERQDLEIKKITSLLRAEAQWKAS